ncbi:hypothetical protein JK359_16250 [Streptomyces actinomycinicus]|uniref:EcsC family protein n=1 Tax=Streptomyces actinomycinicus TaxID=1695166 RepID=A0A937EJY2_9ACTN|nr:hypothetical protein [Streptomyces actinomycinicus]MBL1083506.1 hypothetical protein [Streptomyces actinomycinicus]
MGAQDFGPLGGSFEFIHQNLDGFKIKQQVDERGIEGYINHCARLAAATGAATGAGGGLTLALGIPADMANTVTQQFKVTLAVIYHRTGRYAIGFREFMKIVGLSLGVEVGAKGLEYLVLKAAQEILKRLGAGVAGRMVPLFGAAIGAGLNYAFIRGIGATLLAFADDIFDEPTEGSAEHQAA